MDILNELDFHFLDLQDLNDDDKHHLLTILKPNTIIEALKLPWNIMESNDNANSVAMTEMTNVQNQWYNAIHSAHSYSQQIMTAMCTEWQTYNIPTDGRIPSFIPGMSYPHPGAFNIGAEIHDVSYSRENGRRSGRGRGMKRDNYNRTLNPANEMQSGYMGDQRQFHPQVPIMYIYPDHSVSPQHQLTGQMYYSPPVYSSTLHPHANAHPQTQSTYSTHHQLPENRFMRQSQSVHSQPNQECVRLPIAKSRDKHVQNTFTPAKPAYHRTNEDGTNSSQNNIVTTVIVNNSTLKPVVENVDETTANRKDMNGNGEVSPVNVSIKHNAVFDVNKNCNGIEETEVSHVNINNSIEIKMNGEETDEESKKKTVSSVKRNVVKSSSKPALKVEENEVQVAETTVAEDGQDKIATKMPNSSLEITNVPLCISEPSSISTSKMSWANILKKGNVESKRSSLCKPLMRIDPLPNAINDQNGSPEAPVETVQKTSMATNSVPENQSASSDTQNTVNGYKIPQNNVLQNCCDDPNIFRMGEFLSGYQMAKQTVSLLPRGLTNRSNYCYINSILQALLACPPFYNLLMALPRPNATCRNSTPLINNMVRFVNEFTPLAEGARLPRKDRAHKRKEDAVLDIQGGVAFEPSYVYTMLKHSSAAGIFTIEGRQEDAEEFLSCLLNGINDEMLELMKLVNDQSTPPNTENNVSYDHGEEEWKVMGPKNKGSITRSTNFGRTPLSDIFRGQLRSRVSRVGEQPTDNVQPFFTLQLDIEKAESVKSALEILVGKDQLEGMTCSKTKQQIEAWKQVTLEELPVILILHLKWFDYKLNGCSKILKTVEFPIDLKIDGKFLSSNTVKKLSPKQKQYKLFAVTYHDGKEATKGHYVTDAFHVGYGGWVRYDDSSLKGVSENNVLKPIPPRVPYLLYYRRCDTIGNNQSYNSRR